MNTHDAALTARPRNVVWFERLMYLAVGIDVLSTMLQWDQFVAQIPAYPEAVALGAILAFATDVWLIWLVARRHKNWARWLMLFDFALGIPFTLPWLTSLSVNTVLVCVEWMAQIVAFLLIFTGDAREWFANQPIRQLRPANQEIIS